MDADDTALAEAHRLFLAGRIDDAESTLAAALKDGVVPTPAALQLLADIERKKGRAGAELRTLEALLTVFRSDDQTAVARVWARVAMLRDRQGDPDGAAAAWRRAVIGAPDVAAFHFGLARARFNAGDIGGMRESASELLELFPERAFTHVYAGHVKKAVGEKSEAARSYRRALGIDSNCGEALYNLAEMRGAGGSASLLEQATHVAGREDVSAADRVNAAFAAARILDRDQRFRDAFDYLARANEWAQTESARHGLHYDRDRAQAGVERTIAEYPRATFETAIDDLPVDLVPIFVIGPPRSGTTLIEQILNSHSLIETAGEFTAAVRFEAAFREARSKAGRDGPVDPANAVDAELLETARERYVDALFERGLGGPRIVDKLPANYRIAGFLRAMFPAAPIVHCVRDLRATGFSLFNANFGAHEAWYHDLGDIAHNLNLYRQLISHWESVLEPAFTNVSYEQLVEAPDERIARLLDRLDLPFESVCLAFHESDRPVLTASHEQVRRPVYTSAVNHWRNYSEWLGPVAALPDYQL